MFRCASFIFFLCTCICSELIELDWDVCKPGCWGLPLYYMYEPLSDALPTKTLLRLGNHSEVHFHLLLYQEKNFWNTEAFSEAVKAVNKGVIANIATAFQMSCVQAVLVHSLNQSAGGKIKQSTFKSRRCTESDHWRLLFGSRDDIHRPISPVVTSVYVGPPASLFKSVFISVISSRDKIEVDDCLLEVYIPDLLLVW